MVTGYYQNQQRKSRQPGSARDIGVINLPRGRGIRRKGMGGHGSKKRRKESGRAGWWVSRGGREAGEHGFQHYTLGGGRQKSEMGLLLVVDRRVKWGCFRVTRGDGRGELSM